MLSKTINHREAIPKYHRIQKQMAVVSLPSFLQNLMNVLYIFPQSSFVFNMELLEMIEEKNKRRIFFSPPKRKLTETNGLIT